MARKRLSLGGSSSRAIPLPSNISFETAASVLLTGLTAHYLVHDSFTVNEGDNVVLQGKGISRNAMPISLFDDGLLSVGQLLIQPAKLKGARVLGLTSSADKAHVASSVGADAVALYSDDWVGARVFAGREGVRFCWEHIDGGTVVFYGTWWYSCIYFPGRGCSSLRAWLMFINCFCFITVHHLRHDRCDPALVDPRMLTDTSKTLTGGDLWNMTTTRDIRGRRAGELFGWIAEGYGHNDVHVGKRS
ncbi:hypothetical protein BC936DRAFT_149456 [Jimgerdemannia flammicorona]|uniref:Alcohol dehydrogenase-like C-terminal domain-containing protein n=1 Tax=Jimgerdemannia flammicorona TaxID=994334 RepID=A0A433D0S3_9FUNG|nr:hypothetical protein BC936DRAFT_149456 [Jimgerdemannia flammicorona]